MSIDPVRRTSHGAFWPNQPSHDPFAGYINRTPKLVISKTLKRVE